MAVCRPPGPPPPAVRCPDPARPPVALTPAQAAERRAQANALVQRERLARELLGHTANYTQRRRLRFFLQHGQVLTVPDAPRCLVVPCHWCRFVFPVRLMTLDHLVPKVLGGPDALKNMVPACGPCNQDRGKRWHLSPEGQAHMHAAARRHARTAR